MINISVVISTYKRKRSLFATLNSLQMQTYKNFEIMVVDNANDKDLKIAIDDFNQSSNISAKYIPEPKIGLHYARHTGVKNSNGEILVFTDDDLILAPDWLSAYQNAFSEYPEMVAAGGCVKPNWEITPPEWLIEYIKDRKTFGAYALLNLGDVLKISTDGIFLGCNMAIRRSVFESTGFRPELFGTRTIGNGESGLNEELSENKKLIGYVPDAVAYHNITAERMTVKYIRRWAWHLGGAQMYRKWNGRKRGIINLMMECLSIFYLYGASWVKSVFIYWRKDPKSIDIMFQASLGWCKLSYIWWMLNDPLVQEALDLKEFSP